MRTKQEDVHTHEVALPDGEIVMTGPPIGEMHEEMAESPEPKRAPVTKAEAEAPTSPGLPATPASAEEEAAMARAAWEAKDQSLLPPDGRSIFDRMKSSYLRYVAHRIAIGGGATSRTGRPLRSYADQIGWRGVVQAYDLAPAKRGPVLRLVKNAPRGVIADVRNGEAFVPLIATWRSAADHHERIFTRPIPGSGGARVQVGLTRPNGRKNIIGVWVPLELVGNQPGGGGPINWVHRNMDFIHQIAHADIDYARSIRDPILKRAPGISAGLKFVTRAIDASERIAYGPIYVPFEIDLQGQYMTEREVAKMAHRFVAEGGLMKVMHWQTKTQGTGEPVGQWVESSIAKPRDPYYPRGTWVGGAKYHPTVWPRVESGELTGFSMGGDWTVIPILAAA